MFTINRSVAFPSRSSARAVTVLMANSTLMILGFFAIITVFALHFTNDLRFTVAIVGLALALRQLMQQGLDIFGGAFADRVGYRFSITLGCLIRAMGFIGMGLARSAPQLLLASVVAGFGGMFFDAAGSAAFAASIPPTERARYFSIQATLNNIAAAIGPVIGIVIFERFGFFPVALFGALVFVWIALETALFLPKDIGRVPGAPREAALPLGGVVRAILRNPVYVRVIVLLMGYWMINTQITLTVPLAASARAGKDGVALLLGLNAFLAIPLQYPLVRFAERFFSHAQLLAWSMALTGGGLAVVFWAPSFGWQIAGMVVTTIGTLAIAPITSAITAQVAPPRAIGAFFGFSALSIGLGGGVGQVLGGAIFDAQRHLHLPWLMGVFVIAIALVGTYALARTPAVQTPAHVATLSEESIEMLHDAQPEASLAH